jgi:hypothetical protein
MKRTFNPYLIVLVLYVALAVVLYIKFPVFANSNFFVGSITFFVGGLAFYIYTKQKIDAKRDAAKIILQEIRRAESIISDYKQQGRYQFAKKIIATNSWNKNIHYFVGDLDNDELDRISDLYSTGEYLDSLIKQISDITFDHEVETAKKIGAQLTLQQIGGRAAEEGLADVIIPQLPPVWKGRLDLSSNKLEPIYHSTIVAKLREIAQR